MSVPSRRRIAAHDVLARSSAAAVAEPSFFLERIQKKRLMVAAAVVAAEAVEMAGVMGYLFWGPLGKNSGVGKSETVTTDGHETCASRGSRDRTNSGRGERRTEWFLMVGVLVPSSSLGWTDSLHFILLVGVSVGFFVSIVCYVPYLPTGSRLPP